MAIRGPIGYPGGKWKALDILLPLFPDGIEDWREPFFGGGSVTLGFLQSNKSKDCKRYLVGEIAPEIWAFWVGCKEYAEEVRQIVNDITDKHLSYYEEYHYLKSHGQSYIEVEEKFKEQGEEVWRYLKNMDTSKLSIAERSARTYVMNRISFSGLGESGSLSKSRLVRHRREHVEQIIRVSSLLKNVEIRNDDFRLTIKDIHPEKTFIFFDPPYYTQESGGLYGKDGNTHKNFPHQEFAEVVKKLDCRWLITYDDSVYVRKLFKDYYIEPMKLTYTMAINSSDEALAGEEILIANYDICNNSSYDDIDDIV